MTKNKLHFPALSGDAAFFALLFILCIIYEVFEGDIVNDIVYRIVELFPDSEGDTALCSRAGVWLGIEAGNGSEAALCQTQDHTDGIVLWFFGKHIAAACASDAFDIACVTEHGDDLFEIFYTYPLSFGDVFEGDVFVIFAKGKIEHKAQRIASFGGYLQSDHSFLYLFY